jgi:hypothetical protein
VNTVVNLEVSLNARNFWTSGGIISFSRMPLFLELVYGIMDKVPKPSVM